MAEAATLTAPPRIPVPLATPQGCPARADGDPVCPMTGTTNCDGADAGNCPAC